MFRRRRRNVHARARALPRRAMRIARSLLESVLVTVGDRLRCRFLQFNLRNDFLDLRSLLFEAGGHRLQLALQRCNGGLLLFNSAVSLLRNSLSNIAFTAS